MAEIRPKVQTAGLRAPATPNEPDPSTTTTIAPQVPAVELTPEQKQVIAESDAAGNKETDPDPIIVRKAPETLVPPLRIESAQGLQQPYTSRKVLIDEKGVAVKTADGTDKAQYDSTDVEAEWYLLRYDSRKAYADAFYALGLYGGSKPSATLTDEKDLRVFANLLTASNIEYRSWRATLDLIAKRFIPVPQKGGVSLVDIKRQLDTSAQVAIGRRLRPPEEKIAATAVQARGSATVAGASEDQLQKQVGPEATAYRFAQYVQALNQMLGK